MPRSLDIYPVWPALVPWLDEPDLDLDADEIPDAYSTGIEINATSAFIAGLRELD